jgi:hypothetical protein
MGDESARELLEQFARDVLDRSIAAGGVVQLARVRLGIGDQLPEVVDR